MFVDIIINLDVRCVQVRNTYIYTEKIKTTYNLERMEYMQYPRDTNVKIL
jgi:hypothetical protein